MITDLKSQNVKKLISGKMVFVILFLGAVFFLGGCSSDGENKPGATGTASAGDSSSVTTGDTGGTSATGGMPSEWMTGVGADKWSYPYLSQIGKEFSFSVYFKDRHGVYSGLVHNDNVHFKAEDGAATIESVTVENGIATATLRTHNGRYNKVGNAWELTLAADLLTDPYQIEWMGSAPSGTPSSGRVSVLWYTRGEEWFTEKEGDSLNDLYDLGEHFKDTEDDPYLDENENGSWDAEEPWVDKNNNGQYDAAEMIIDKNGNGILDSDDIWVDKNDNGQYDDVEEMTSDTNGNGVWDWGELFVDANDNKQRDSYNGKWDADKYIFGNATFLLTGDQPYIGWNKTPKTIASEDSGSISIVVCDGNYNHLPAGATIEFSAKDADNKPVVVAPKKISYADNAGSYGLNAAGQISVITNTLTLNHSGFTGPVTITVKVSGEGIEETEATISGVVEFDPAVPAP